MRKLAFLALSGILALSVSGCNFFGGGEDTVTDQTVIEPVPSPDGAAEQPATDPTGEPVAEEPVAEEPPAPPQVVASADLIQSTNSNERIRQINQGQRQDPFARVVVPPPPAPAETTTTTPGQVPQVPTLPGGTPGAAPGGQGQPGSGPGAAAPGGGQGRPGQTTAQRPQGASPQQPGASPQQAGGSPQQAGAQTPGARPGTPSPLEAGIANLPPIPQPDLATAVIVTGVVQVGGTTHAIINAPNEPTSRYVRVGQRIANGQVLVKRIEMGGASEPVVIFEEQGVEVAKRVGEGGPDANQTTASAATTPTS
jgi:hypothetical protein